MQDCASIQIPHQFVERSYKFTIGCKYRKLRLPTKINAIPEWGIEASHGCEID